MMQEENWCETWHTGPIHLGQSVPDENIVWKPRVWELWVGGTGLLGILLTQHTLRQSTEMVSLCLSPNHETKNQNKPSERRLPYAA